MDNKLIEKIQKLISLADSPNENEAKAAMAKAQELMLKHNIDMRSVQNHDSEYVHETTDTFKREHPNMKYINNLINEFFFVKVVKSCRRGGSYFNYIGEKNNVDTALHTVNFLKATFDRLWKEYKAETGAGRGSKSSFIYGLYKGLEAKLTEQRMAAEQQYGLVLVDDPRAEEKMREIFNNLRSGNRSRANLGDASAINAGRSAAAGVSFSAGSLK